MEGTVVLNRFSRTIRQTTWFRARIHPCAEPRRLTYCAWKSVQEPGLLWKIKRSQVGPKHLWCAISRIRGKETPWGIVIKFCMWVGIRDIITYATFGDNRLWGLGVARGRFPISPIDLRRRPYNTLALPSLSKNTFIFGSLSTCARRLYVQMNIWPALGRTLLRHDTKNNGHKYEAMYYLQLAYFICELALVPRLSPNIQKNCAFCDTSTKFGTNVH